MQRSKRSTVSESPRRLRRAFVAFSALLSVLAPAPAAEALEQLYIVRHAEKQTPWPESLNTFQPLSAAGDHRAAGLAAAAKDFGLTAVYSSPTTRTVHTGMPTSEALGIPLEADPRSLGTAELKAFFDDLRTRHGDDRAVLIVAHSNTIPQLLRHLGADPSCDDALGIRDAGEYELIDGYDGLWVVDLATEGCQGMRRETLAAPAVEESAGAPVSTAEDDRPVRLDPTRLVDGEQRYSMRYGSEPMGTVTQRVERRDDGLTVHVETAISRAQIRRQTTVVHGGDGLALHSITVQGAMGPSEADVAVQVQDGKLSGHSDFPRSRRQAQGRLTVDRPAPEGVLEQAALVPLLPALPIERTGYFGLVVYDATRDAVHPVDVRVQGPEDITVPAGTFSADRVDLLGGNPELRVWVSREETPKVLRVEHLGQSWAYELLKTP